MELFKQLFNLIDTGARRTDVDILVALLLFYMAVVAALFLIDIIKGIKR